MPNQHPALALIAHRGAPGRRILVASTVACLFATHAASAQQTTTVGLGVSHTASAYRGYDSDTLPFPFFTWEGKKFYAHGLDFGYKLTQSDTGSLSISVSPLPFRFRSKDSSDWRMKQLDDRDFLAAAGLEWNHGGSWGQVGAKAQAEITGVGGFIADVHYNYPLSQGKVAIIPEVGVSYQSEEITQHYYRVSGAEAARSGLARYTPGDSISPYASVTVAVPLGARWTGTATLRRALLDDSITDSPMVEADHQDVAVLTLSRSF